MAVIIVGGPGSERGREGGRVEIGGKQPKSFPTKQKHFRQRATRKVFIQLPTSGLKVSEE